MHHETWDAIIIGGGSGGLSAALMLVRARRRVLVVDSGAPRNRFAAHMHGVLGRDGWSPLDLLATGRTEIERYGGVVTPAEVVAVAHDDSGFDVELGTGDRHRARRLLIATGLHDELPDIPGLAEQWGRGAFVCPYCDGWEWRDRRIGVLATGPMSAHQAQMLRQWSPDVAYFTNGAELPDDTVAELTARGIAVERRAIAGTSNDDDGRLSGIRLSDGDTATIDVIFLHPRVVPNDGLLLSLGAATVPGHGGAPWVEVDETGRTSVDGVWAVGNVVNPSASVPVASGAGNVAGATINADLIEEEIQTALAAAEAAALTPRS
ncbi:NAD(P)/FAD-dependent oxidoreductase [Agromyces sp. H66]|uniref:NAD(P)/FAD-dependent oxidoreductase n=1 Tax=Agromyces sp. H66 TaxID=2529859 RepID=UPI0020BEE4A2|nr:NAD(P)/FAD-dependent oxidoreductase [Agromyces sp. H66]